VPADHPAYANEPSGFQGTKGRDDGIAGQAGTGFFAYATFELRETDGIVGLVPPQGASGDEIQEPTLG
jgi:hypothetical protein